MILIFKSSHRAWRSKSFHFLVSTFLPFLLLCFFCFLFCFSCWWCCVISIFFFCFVLLQLLVVLLSEVRTMLQSFIFNLKMNMSQGPTCGALGGVLWERGGWGGRGPQANGVPNGTPKPKQNTSLFNVKMNMFAGAPMWCPWWSPLGGERGEGGWGPMPTGPQWGSQTKTKKPNF